MWYTRGLHRSLGWVCSAPRPVRDRCIVESGVAPWVGTVIDDTPEPAIDASSTRAWTLREPLSTKGHCVTGEMLALESGGGGAEGACGERVAAVGLGNDADGGRLRAQQSGVGDTTR